MRALSSDGVGNAFRVEMAERWETQERTNRALMYRMFGEIADPPDESAMVAGSGEQPGGRLRIPPREVKRRMRGGRAHPADARDGGCTRPDCLHPATTARSTTARTGHPTAPPTPTNCSSPAAPTTNCVTDGHYHTSVTDTGRLAWTDGTTPPDINHAHHPEELLHGNTDPPHNDGD